MESELLILAGFLGVQVCFHYIEHCRMFQKLEKKGSAAEKKAHRSLMAKKLTTWASVLAFLTSPVTLHTAKDYVTHIVIYSGYVIATHK